MIAGTGIRVSDIVHYKALYEGEDWVAKTVRALPHLTSEQVKAAIAFYGDNRDEIDRYIAKEESIDKEMQSRQRST